MDQRQQIEYAQMRETIRQRGTARMVLVPLVFLGWAATAVATWAAISVGISTLLPLLVLAAGFEAIFALHMNVERIGRYLQVFHEAGGGWEQVAMEYGKRFPGTGPDPLFTQLFVFGVSANFLPVIGGEYVEMVVMTILHLAAIYRVRTARRTAAKQRAEDLERFSQLRE